MMNKRILLISSITLLITGSLYLQLEAMFNNNGILGEAMHDMARELERQADHAAEEMQRMIREQQRILDIPVPQKPDSMPNDQYQVIVRKYEQDQKRAQAEFDRLTRQKTTIQNGIISMGEALVANINGQLGKAENERKAKEKLKEIVVENATKNQGLVAVEKERAKGRLEEIKLQGEETRKKIAAFVEIATDAQKRKAFMMLTGGVVGIGAGAYYSIKFLAHVAEDLYRVPALAEKTTILPWYTQLYNWLFDVEPVFGVTLDDVILDKELEGFFRGFVRSTQNTIENGGYCRHLLLPGPPGTGKTMMSFALANELQLPAIYFNAGKLSNCSVEDALVRIEKLFNYAEHSPVPVVIIIDESEVIFKHRNSPDLTEKTRLIMNDIMAKTGTEQNNFILIALTNRPDDFDAAFKSRFSETIYIHPPTYEQRKTMLEKYIDEYLINPVFTPKKSWRSLLKKPTESKNKIAIGRDVFSAQVLEEIAKKIDGFSGRDISQMVLGIREEAYAHNNPQIDRELVEKVVARKIDKKQREMASIKTNAA